MPAAVRQSPLAALTPSAGIGMSVGGDVACVTAEMLSDVKEIYPDERQLLSWGALTLVAHKTDGAVTVLYEGRASSGDLFNDLTQ